MSIEGLVVSGILFVVLVSWVVLPYTQQMSISSRQSVVERQRERLDIYYNRVLRNLRDIDEDYTTGKLAEAEYTVERERWVQRGILALKAIDELDEQHLVAPETASNAGIDETIETTIHTYQDAPV